MKKRILSLLMAAVMLLGMMVVPANAASTLEEAMKDVDVYARNDDLNWLMMNGSVATQHYTYYLYQSEVSGETKEIPAYCTDPRLYGVPALVPQGTAIQYNGESTVSDPKIMGIVANGYPHIDLGTLGLNTIEEAYYATKTALWCYLLGTWSIDGLSVNPSADQAAANRVLEAARTIYTRGVKWDKLVEPKLTATPDRDVAYAATVNGQSVYQQIFTVTSETWSYYPVTITLAEGAPAGTKLLDMNNNPVSSLDCSDATSGSDGYSWQVKVVYPAASVEGQEGTVQLNLSSVVVQYELYHATCLETGTYGNAQRYVLDTDPHTPISASAISTYSSDPPPPDDSTPDGGGGTAIKIIKLEEGTNTPLAGAVFEVVSPDGDSVGTFSTSANGTITVPVSVTGSFSVTELTAPAFHLLPEVRTQHVTVVHGKTAEVTFVDAPFGNLRIEKYSNTGEPLSGATFQVRHLGTGETLSGQTGPGGALEFTKLKPGGVEVRETVGIEGWQADTETVKTATIVAGETSTVTFTNRELPGLRIVKYDRTTNQPLSGVTFEIFKDTVSLGQYTTDQLGEILLTNCEPGTYLIREVQSLDSHITDATPQEIKLEAGTGIHQIVFFNDKKPGMHIVKVDSANLSKPIANAKFEIRAVNGGYGPEEFVTGADGTIDLSLLPPGAYVVTEKSCPGYVIDDSQRIIELKGNDNAEFVFTNSKLPGIHLIKLDWKGDPLPGVTFRLSKIADGTNYLDRTTDENGEIFWEGLDCSADEDTVYSLRELSTVISHILDPREYHIQVFPGKTSTKVLQNDRRSTLFIHKTDADTGEPIEGTVFLVKSADGHSIAEVETDERGVATVENLLPQVVEVIEKSVPPLYLLDAPSQLATLFPNRDRDVYFQNHKKPNITVRKLNAVTDEPLENAKFTVEYASNNTSTGEMHDLGTFYTNELGEFSLPSQNDGWFKISEVLPPRGYALSEPSVQEFYLKAGTSKVVIFKNMPLSALVVYKFDTVTGEPLSNCLFELRYFSGPTNTGGTVIATGRTGSTGTYTFTGLKKGTYQVVELASDGEHLASSEPQTVYISGEDQDVVTVFFGNVPFGSVLVTKVDEKTGAPLSDVEFEVSTSDGTLINGGRYVTDSTGSFLVENLIPGTSVVVKEKRAKDDSYILDDTAQIAVVQPGRTAALEFRNSKKGSLIINKLSTTGEPLEGVKFSLRYANGGFVDNAGGALSSNGLYFTNKAGQITITDVIGTVVVTEEESIPGYTIDENTRTQTVVVNPYDTQNLYFYNEPVGGVLITKVNADDESERIPNTTFEIHRLDHGIVDVVTTGDNGTVFLSLADGGYYAVETKAGKNFALDNTPHYFEVKNGKTTPLVITNKAYGGVEIHKIDAVTGEGVYGAKFLLYDGSKNPIAEAVSDQDGYARFENLTLTGWVYLKELECEGYQVDTQLKTVSITAGKTTLVEWKNTPITGQIQITKTSEDYNSMNGWPAGTPIPGTVFEIYHYRTGNLVDTIRTDKNGVASSKPLPLGRYKLIESQAADFYGLDKTPIEVEIEFAGQIVKAAMTNKSLYTNVSVTKRGYVEVMPGQTIRYDFSNIANNSTTALESFYWRDTLPTNAVRLDKIVTGTWNANGNYKIVYKTNYSGDEYRVLADNLATNRSYVLNASPAALGLASGEYVTEFMAVFGVVPSNFRQVEAPQVYCTVLSTLSNGTEFVNVTDVGGLYNGQWIMAVDRWTTRVYAPSKPLPRTGY